MYVFSLLLAPQLSQECEADCVGGPQHLGKAAAGPSQATDEQQSRLQDQEGESTLRIPIQVSCHEMRQRQVVGRKQDCSDSCGLALFGGIVLL